MQAVYGFPVRIKLCAGIFFPDRRITQPVIAVNMRIEDRGNRRAGNFPDFFEQDTSNGVTTTAIDDDHTIVGQNYSRVTDQSPVSAIGHGVHSMQYKYIFTHLYKRYLPDLGWYDNRVGPRYLRAENK